MSTTLRPTQTMQISSATERGPRNYQEDRAVIIPGTSLILAMFDGHGGAWVAEECARLLPEIAARYEDAPLADIFAALHDATCHVNAGATATIARVRNGTLEFGVLGDSPIALRKADGTLITGACHNVRTNLVERAAAEARGGIYERGYLFAHRMYEGLQMSRALGDVSLASVLSREPELGTAEIAPGDVLILASDGVLYEGADLEKLFAFDSADAIVTDALARRTHDNVSVIRVAF